MEKDDFVFLALVGGSGIVAGVEGQLFTSTSAHIACFCFERLI